MNYLLDTNVISELVAKQPSSKVLHWLRELDDNQIYLSAITIGELKQGIEKLPDSLRKDTLREWLANDLLVRFSTQILPIDLDVMLTWGQLSALLGKKGRILPVMDSLMAALALQRHLTLVTRNEGDFKDTGVTIINPWL